MGTRKRIVTAAVVGLLLAGLHAGCKTTTTQRSGVSGIQTPPMFGESDKAKPASGAVVPAGYQSPISVADPKAECKH